MSAPEPRPGEGKALPRQEEGCWWVAPMWTLVALFAAVTAYGSHHFGISVRDPQGAWFLHRVTLSLGLFVLLALVDAGVRANRRGWTFRSALEVLRARWTRGRLALAMTGLLAYHVVYFCYHNLKSWNVFNEPRDDLLHRWDRGLFLGHSPAELLHDLLGQHVAAYVLTLIYVSFTAVLSVAFVAALVFTDRIRQGYVFIASAMWVWILGVGAYYLIPSLGPFSYAPEEFAGLARTMTQDTQARYLAQRAHLLAEPQAHDATAQIAAFASLHVAIMLMILLMVRYYRLHRATQAMTIYVTGTVLATVYLGWHFAVDIVGGFVIAYAAVYCGRLTIYPRSTGALPIPRWTRRPSLRRRRSVARETVSK